MKTRLTKEENEKTMLQERVKALESQMNEIIEKVKRVGILI